MPDENSKLEWRILGESVLGASHSRSGKPNQDRILRKQAKTDTGMPLVMAIADGHGSDKYFRSDVGAQSAVEAAERAIHHFVSELPPDLSTVKNFGAIKHIAEKLPNTILYYWHEAVEKHWQENRPTDAEWKWLNDKANAKARQEISANPAKPYGTTLLAVLITNGFIFYLQLGDGDILEVSETGEVTRPVPGDERLLGNETTSLASAMPKDFRSHFQPLTGTPPALILLSTDGYANSFEEVEGFLKVGSDIWSIIQKEGIQKVAADLPGWLTSATKTGSGDDITLGILCRMSALDKMPPTKPLDPTDASQQPVLPDPISDTYAPKVPTTQGSKDENASPLPEYSNTPQPTVPAQFPSGVTIPNSFQTSGQNVQGDNLSGRPGGTNGYENSPITAPDGQISGTQAELLKDSNPQPGGSSFPQQPMGDRGNLVATQSSGTPIATTPAVPLHQRQILTVSSKGDAQYTSIRDALKNAPPYAQIRVQPGTYSKSLTIDKPVEIVGEIDGGPVIIKSLTPCIHLQANDVAFRNLTLRGEIGMINVGGFLPKNNPVIDISHSNLILDQCDITSESLACLHIHGATAQPTLHKCYIHDSKGKGIVFSENAHGRVNNCIITGHAEAAIELKDGSNPTIQGCHIYEGKGVGIFAWNNCRGTITDCTIYGNASSGIEIRKGGDPLIQVCQIFDGKGHGILIDENGQGQIIACTIYGNTFAGIEIQESNPTIQRCIIFDGKKSGIAVSNRGIGQIEECYIRGNASAGIEIKGSNPTILQCHIHDGKHTGIFIDSRGGAIVTGGNIYGNARSGIELQEGSTITVRECFIHHGQHFGLFFGINTSGKVEKCTITHNAKSGIAMQQSGNINILGSHINENAEYALHIQNASRVTVDGCDLSKNRIGAWDIDSTSHLNHKDNQE